MRAFWNLSLWLVLATALVLGFALYSYLPFAPRWTAAKATVHCEWLEGNGIWLDNSECLILYDRDTGRERWRVPAKTPYFHNSGNGRRIFFCGEGGTKLLDAKAQRILDLAMINPLLLLSTTFSPDGDFLCVRRGNHELKLIDAHDGTIVTSAPKSNLAGPADDQTCTSFFTPDSRIWVVTWQNAVESQSHFWDRESRIWSTPTNLDHRQMGSWDGRYFLQHSKSGEYLLRDLVRRTECLLPLAGPVPRFSPDCRFIICASVDEPSFKLWDLEGNAWLAQIPVEIKKWHFETWAVKVTSDKSQVIVVAPFEATKVFDAVTSRLLWQADDPLFYYTQSVPNKILLVRDQPRRLDYHDIRSGRVLSTLRLDSSVLITLNLEPASRYCVIEADETWPSFGWPKKLTEWLSLPKSEFSAFQIVDLPAERVIASIRGKDCAISKDGTRLYMTGNNFACYDCPPRRAWEWILGLPLALLAFGSTWRYWRVRVKARRAGLVGAEGSQRVA